MVRSSSDRQNHRFPGFAELMSKVRTILKPGVAEKNSLDRQGVDDLPDLGIQDASDAASGAIHEASLTRAGTRGIGR
jgi:hypothetical protein